MKPTGSEVMCEINQKGWGCMNMRDYSTLYINTL